MGPELDDRSCERKRPSIRKNIGWEATFPGAPEGELSAVFMKRVIFAFASDLLSRRRLLAATEFRKRQVEYLRFNILDKKSATGSTVSEILKGALDALDLTYLKEILIIVCQSPYHDDDGAVEVYKFSIIYGQKNVASASASEEARHTWRISYRGVDSVHKQIAYITQRIHALADCLPPLPDGCYTTIKVTYCEGTPSEYQPNGFTADSKLFRFVKPAGFVVLGKVDCEFHSCRVSAESVLVGDSLALRRAVDNYYLSFSLQYSGDEFSQRSENVAGRMRQRSTSVNSSFCNAVKTFKIDHSSVTTAESGHDSNGSMGEGADQPLKDTDELRKPSEDPITGKEKKSNRSPPVAF